MATSAPRGIHIVTCNDPLCVKRYSKLCQDLEAKNVVCVEEGRGDYGLGADPFHEKFKEKVDSTLYTVIHLCPEMMNKLASVQHVLEDINYRNKMVYINTTTMPSNLPTAIEQAQRLRLHNDSDYDNIVELLTRNGNPSDNENSSHPQSSSAASGEALPGTDNDEHDKMTKSNRPSSNVQPVYDELPDETACTERIYHDGKDSLSSGGPVRNIQDLSSSSLPSTSETTDDEYCTCEPPGPPTLPVRPKTRKPLKGVFDNPSMYSSWTNDGDGDVCGPKISVEGRERRMLNRRIPNVGTPCSGQPPTDVGRQQRPESVASVVTDTDLFENPPVPARRPQIRKLKESEKHTDG